MAEQITTAKLRVDIEAGALELDDAARTALAQRLYVAQVEQRAIDSANYGEAPYAPITPEDVVAELDRVRDLATAGDTAAVAAGMDLARKKWDSVDSGRRFDELDPGLQRALAVRAAQKEADRA